MTFTHPQALLLLIFVLPVVAYIGWPRTRFRRRRDVLSLMIRIVILVLLISSLAGVQIIRATERLSVVFLLDVSDSVSITAQSAGLDFIEQSMRELRPDDLAGVVVFAQDAQIARIMSNSRDLNPILATPNAGNTDYAAAIRLALAMLPQDSARRIVLISDGIPTSGDWESAAQLAVIADVEISYVPYRLPSQPDVLVRSVDVPSLLNEDQDFTLTATLYSEESTSATVTVLVGGEIVSRQSVTLEAGETVYPLRLRSGTTGFRDFEVRVEPDGDDHFYQNNRLSAFSRVEGTPRVLLVDGGRSATVNEVAYLLPALNDAGLDVEVVSPQDIPSTLDGLANYRSVILANVSAVTIPPQRLQNLETYVRDLGGGLVVIGGPESYAPGGYYQTPLEDALPVEMQVHDEERLPTLTIAYVIDRSGSMNSLTPSGITWLDIAKEAIIRSIDFLTPNDRAGIASFDSSAFWIAELQAVQNRAVLQELVATIRAGGGTSIRAGMDLVAQSIVEEPSNLKHIIMLTDGGAAREGLPELAEDLFQQENVTTTVISIGEWETDFMQEMADLGGGNYYQVIDAATIPLIFAAETVLISRTYIQEQDFTPARRPHAILQGIGSLPELRGYVSTTARPAATVILQGIDEYEDPILAVWQYGLGRSAAFTSDATARWGQNWINWADFATFWGQVVRWTMTEGASTNLETRIVNRDGQTVITVDARTDEGDFLNGLDLTASVVYTLDGSARRVGLRQIAPGRYEGTFQPTGEGAYLLHVGTALTDDEAIPYTQTTGWVVGYSAEYDSRPPDEDVLTQLSALTGGTNLTGNPQGALAPTVHSSRMLSPIWPYLMLAAILLLPLDIAIRRLIITASDLSRLRAWMFTPRNRPMDEESSARMNTLREARERARSTTLKDRDASITEGAIPQKPPAPSMPPPSAPEPRPEVRKDSPTSTSSDDNIGSRLLKKRRGE